MSVKDVQIFLEFARFYQCFIAGFFQTIKPLMEMTKSSHVMIKSGKNKVK